MNDLAAVRRACAWLVLGVIGIYSVALFFEALAAFGDFAFAFVSGFVIEAVAVFWVHYSERGRKWSAGAMSALQATALFYGAHSDSSAKIAACFIVGYALGSVCAVTAKEWRRKDRARSRMTQLHKPSA
jgi:hypothetical protein